MLPKVAGADEIRAVGAALARGGGALPLIVQIETAAGLLAAADIAAASPHVSAVFFAPSTCRRTWAARGWEALLYARSRVVLAAGAAGVAALDSRSWTCRRSARWRKRPAACGASASPAGRHPSHAGAGDTGGVRAQRGGDGLGAQDRRRVRAAAGRRAAGRGPAHRAPGGAFRRRTLRIAELHESAGNQA